MLTVVEAWDFTKVPFIIDENSAAKSSAAAVSTQLDHLVTQLDTWDNTAQAVMKKSQFMSEPQLTLMTSIAGAIPRLRPDVNKAARILAMSVLAAQIHRTRNMDKEDLIKAFTKPLKYTTKFLKVDTEVLPDALRRRLLGSSAQLPAGKETAVVPVVPKSWGGSQQLTAAATAKRPLKRLR